MKRIIIDCWEVTQPDMGGMCDDHVAFVSSEEVAKDLASKHSYGWPCTYHKFSKEYVVFESFNETVDYNDEAEREAALAKLTARERKVLGLK